MLRKEERLYARLLDRVAFERIAADLLILGKHDPVPLPGTSDPIDVGRILREMIVMDLNAGTRNPQGLRDDALPKAAVYEKDD